MTGKTKTSKKKKKVKKAKIKLDQKKMLILGTAILSVSVLLLIFTQLVIGIKGNGIEEKKSSGQEMIQEYDQAQYHYMEENHAEEKPELVGKKKKADTKTSIQKIESKGKKSVVKERKLAEMADPTKEIVDKDREKDSVPFFPDSYGSSGSSGKSLENFEIEQMSARDKDSGKSVPPKEDIKPAVAEKTPEDKDAGIKNAGESVKNPELKLETKAVAENSPSVPAVKRTPVEIEVKEIKPEVPLKTPATIAKNDVPVKNVQNVPAVQDKTENLNKFGFPLAVNGKAFLVVIFDDGGQNMAQLEKCVTLPFPVTVAVLPKLAYSAAAARRVRESGNEVMLHQPMQAVNLKVNPGAGAILPDMFSYEIESLLKENISEIGPVAGINNHEGSLITEDEVRMRFILQLAHDQGIFFLDSRTTTETKVPSVAMDLGYSYYQRDVFLDNTKNRADILNEIKKGVAIANKKGTAIMIGHVWSADILPAVLNEVYPELKAKGYVFTTVAKSGALITP